MTNPNDAIGTNAAYGTRTSVNAFNDIAQLVNGRGILSGFSVVPKSGMTVSVGGIAGTRDVAVAEDNLGNRTCINNRSVSSIDVTIAAAGVSSNRYDAIVVYANNPAQASDTTPDAPGVCGIIAVEGGTTGVSENQIRAAITADGGTGSVAYYAVVATIYVGAGTATITGANISQSHISISADDIGDGEIVGRMIASGAVSKDNMNVASFTSDDISSDFTWDSGTSSSIESDRVIILQKIGNTIFLPYLQVARSDFKWSTSWLNVGTLPASAKPIAQSVTATGITVNRNDGSPGVAVRVLIGSDGLIRVRATSAVTNSQAAVGGLSWTVA